MRAETILVVDHTNESLMLLVKILEKEKYRVLQENAVQRALATIELQKPDLIIIDVHLPEISGIELCRQIKANGKNKSIPIILMSDEQNSEERVQGLVAGAADWITAPFLQGEFLARVAIQLKIIELQKQEIRARMHAECMLRLIRSPISSVADFLDFAMHEVIAITESKYGFVLIYDEKQQACVLNSWSGDVMSDCAVITKDTVFPLATAGFWAEAIRQRRPILVNDFSVAHPHKKGLPSGHVNIKRFLSVPVIEADKILCVVAVANKDGLYDASDIDQLTILMDSAWSRIEEIREQEAKEIAEREKAFLLAGLQNSAKLMSIGRLAGGVAHEINNPLTIISMDLESLKKKFETAETDSKIITQVDRSLAAVRRISDIVKNLQVFVKSNDAEKTSVSMHAVVQQAVNLVRKMYLNKGIEISMNLIAPNDVVSGVVSCLEQAIMALLENAHDALLSESEKQLRQICLSSRCQDFCFELIVSDNGKGMDQDTLKRVFEPFFTTKSAQKGIGFGMFTAQSIVTEYEGFISVSSTLGVGTEFIMCIPLLLKAKAEVDNANSVVIKIE